VGMCFRYQITSQNRGGGGMKGQLWQECYCGTEPVCSVCEKCRKHCTCGKPEQHIIDTTPMEPYRRGIGQGFGATDDGEAL
jgi:hypothetical protein